MNFGTGSTSVEKLNDENYETWKLQIKSILVYNDLWGFVSGDDEKPKTGETKDWTTKDSKALALITLSLTQNQLGYIKKAVTSAEAWRILEKIHATRGPTRKVILYKLLFQMKKVSGHPMTQHLRDFQEKVDKLEEVGITIPKELLVIMLLNSLPDEYENFCIAMETRDDLPDIDVLKVKLLEEEDRRLGKTCDGDSNQNALVTNENVMRSHTHKDMNKNKLRNSKFNGQCFKCKKRGHMASECRSKKKEGRKETSAMTAAKMESVKECKGDV